MDKIISLIKKQISNKGMTLVEVLISITILSIIVVAFTNLLGWSTSNIFTMGVKSQAVATAMEITDRIGHKVAITKKPEQGIAALEGDADWVGSEDFNDLYTEESKTKEHVFYYDAKYKEVEDEIGSEIEGYEVTVVVFYEEAKYHVKLESFILQPKSSETDD
ncbi:prepilin-type N-terminal cleavage/methylation domain-containing protein [Desulfotomaculum sp. 1211_IL3151]|uniref:prepilin-type N-terminal cleavage/methylation domain-containing protein n=1 Tax=Desulfotomaculum sp. 1211_IL3151 TaxID=3084055 RepID=UPI002FD8B901